MERLDLIFSCIDRSINSQGFVNASLTTITEIRPKLEDSSSMLE
jgi:hypothetical protein